MNSATIPSSLERLRPQVHRIVDETFARHPVVRVEFSQVFHDIAEGILVLVADEPDPAKAFLRLWTRVST